MKKADKEIKEKYQAWIATAPAPRLGNALVCLYKRQTPSEQASHSTHQWNKIGFSQDDARIMTSLAEWFIGKGFFTEKQLAVVRRRLSHYWRQLSEIAEEMKASS